MTKVLALRTGVLLAHTIRTQLSAHMLITSRRHFTGKSAAFRKCGIDDTFYLLLDFLQLPGLNIQLSVACDA